MYIIRAILRRKWIIIISTSIALITAYLLTRNLKKEYLSIAQLATDFTVSESPDPAKGVNFFQSELRFNNAIENISSPKVLGLVSYRLLLHDLQSEPFTVLPPEHAAKLRFNKESVVTLLTSRIDSLELLQSAVPEQKLVLDILGAYKYNTESIKRNLKVERFQKSDYINIEYRSENPYLSAFIVNSVCEQFKRFYGINETQRSTMSIITLDSLVRQRREALDQKHAAKEQFMISSGLIDPGLEGSSKLSQISNYESLLIEEKSTLRNQSFRVKELDDLIKAAQRRGVSSIAAPRELSESNDVAANSEYLRLRKQHSELYADYIRTGGNDPEMKKRLDDLSKDMTRIILVERNTNANGVASEEVTVEQLVQKKIDAQAQQEAAVHKIRDIESKLSQLRSSLSGVAASTAATQQFDKEIEIASNEYTTVKDQLNAVLNFSETKTDNFKQTIIGQPASQPLPSKRLMLIAFSGFSAFFLACVVIVLLEMFDNSIKTPSQFLRLTNLPLLGTVPKTKLEGKNVLDKIALFDEKETSRNNPFLEFLRKLRYELENSSKSIFLITSTEPQQGKTMLVQALSYILSLGKKKVLIIDTNFCNNDITVGTNASPVLENFELNGKPFDKASINSFVTKSSVEGIDVIGCKGGDYTPSEILPKNHLLKYLGQLKSEYDFILLEGAPLNEYTDTKELLPFVDGMIAVFSAEADFTTADKESIKFLESKKEKFIGAILNKIEEQNLEL
ncbi:MAG: hypothetical protein KIT80_16575 [Chitinophagaceae bacterium]|nr:hypothetical protein [Chitinophagaceae bacterium]MCW5928534.1 hypothetical protein [Chitinophagaceae bacterium]